MITRRFPIDAMDGPFSLLRTVQVASHIYTPSVPSGYFGTRATTSSLTARRSKARRAQRICRELSACRAGTGGFDNDNTTPCDRPSCQPRCTQEPLCVTADAQSISCNTSQSRSGVAISSISSDMTSVPHLSPASEIHI